MYIYIYIYSWIQFGDAIREYFVGPIFFLMANFMIQRFPVAGCMRKTENRNTEIHFKQRIVFRIDFNNCQFFI